MNRPNSMMIAAMSSLAGMGNLSQSSLRIGKPKHRPGKGGLKIVPPSDERAQAWFYAERLRKHNENFEANRLTPAKKRAAEKKAAIEKSRRLISERRKLDRKWRRMPPLAPDFFPTYEGFAVKTKKEPAK